MHSLQQQVGQCSDSINKAVISIETFVMGEESLSKVVSSVPALSSRDMHGCTNTPSRMDGVMADINH